MKKSAPPEPLLIFDGIRDNHSRGTVADFLRDRVLPGSALSIVSAYFTIHAYDALRASFDRIEGLRFLFGEPRFLASLDPEKTEKKVFRVENDELELGNQLRQREVARRCAQWIRERVAVRSVREAGFLHGKLYHIHDGHREHALVGSSNLTLRGLGMASRPNIELNLVVDGDRDRADLKAWFDEIWGDESLVTDVKAEVLRYLEQVYANHTPEFVYFKTLFHIFGRSLAGQTELAEALSDAAITSTGIWNALYDFQKDAAKGAIRKINAYGGCILADSVGLGKTYTALAVIKYFELRNHRVLVLCPKKLSDNWTQYLALAANRLNPFPQDRFGYTVLAHTDLSRDSGQSGPVDLAKVNWGGFDLVVVDESHNFRNNLRGRRGPEDAEPRPSRYERLMRQVIQAGVKTRVLLLSATPVNNNLSDLRNQIEFITEGRDDAFAESLGIASLRDAVTLAQRVFLDWVKTPGEKDSRELLERLPGAIFALLDGLTIARSRKHIRKYYAGSLPALGGFPARRKPISLSSRIDLHDQFLDYDRLNREIEVYKLSLFNPSHYVLPEFERHYGDGAVRNFSQSKREHFLIGMMKVNFLKRLESSVHAFRITMDRTVAKIEELEGRLEGFLRRRQERAEVEVDGSGEFDAEDEETAEAFQVGKALRFEMAHLRVGEWLEDLARDRHQLESLAEHARAVTPERDAKLAELRALLARKFAEPTSYRGGGANRKALVFTAFADTAAYLYENLAPWAQETFGLHCGLVCGSGPNRATLGRLGFQDILTNFAPRAKQRDRLQGMPQGAEIDLLIATDCISEGQNLQDCDLLINYDIHWNPVRIIQRFGRIDRLGSPNETVQLVNFWPTNDLNLYINLKNRVEARMALVDLAASAEDNLLAGELEELIQEDLRYRDRQLLRLRDEVLDMEDFNEGVALTDFSLDDFRMELAAFIARYRRQLEEAPLGLYAVVPAQGAAMPGVVFCLRQRGESAAAEAVNPLQPYFLVYIRDDGDVRLNFAQAKQVLDLMRALCSGRDEVFQALCDGFDRETVDGSEMGRYSALLRGAFEAIVKQFSRRAGAALLDGRSARLIEATARPREMGDFELVTWLVISGASVAGPVSAAC
ncbi:MAG TPA: helicase-related protein [Terriglobales bacterium]|nr:helicase-related protein [Terriglobales bacterium]